MSELRGPHRGISLCPECQVEVLRGSGLLLCGLKSYLSCVDNSEEGGRGPGSEAGAPVFLFGFDLRRKQTEQRSGLRGAGFAPTSSYEVMSQQVGGEISTLVEISPPTDFHTLSRYG